jgi:AraC-like DNA-binding protein
MTLGDLCRGVGVNSRTLQHWFQREFGCGPMQYLRKIRIEHVRSNLLRPRIGTSVTSEAARWGFFALWPLFRRIRIVLWRTAVSNSAPIEAIVGARSLNSSFLNTGAGYLFLSSPDPVSRNAAAHLDRYPYSSMKSAYHS